MSVLPLVLTACFELSASASIIYTAGFGNQHGIGWPDRGVYVQDIDLDGDGAYDFYFRGGVGFEFWFVPVGQNRILSTKMPPPGQGRFTFPLTAGAVIGSFSDQAVWLGNADAESAYDFGSVVFSIVGTEMGPAIRSTIPADEVRYLALEYHREGELHYAWVAIQSRLFHNNWVDVKGWAWNSEPNIPIIAGAVPEPSGGLLGLLSAAVWLLRRRRCSTNHPIIHPAAVTPGSLK